MTGATATVLLRLYQAVRTPLGCLGCDANHAAAMRGPFYCACACHDAAGQLVAAGLLETIPRRRTTDLQEDDDGE